jgi:pimeloyl-ACP methyl ester carboxylesterase
MADRPPIVFLPGVMGSRLYFESSGKFWDPDSTWRMLRLMPVWPFRSDDDNRRELQAGEPAAVMIDPLDAGSMDAQAVKLGWGGVVWSYYDEFLETLRTLAGNGQAFAIGYDWRQDIRWLGEYTARKLGKVLEATGAERLALATHSMGGLVARAALRHDPTLSARISTFLSICQPAVGAVIIYRRMFTGMVPGLDGGTGIADRAFRLLLGNSREGFLGNMSGLPGAMQLLPSEFFPADAANLPWNSFIAAGVGGDDQLFGNPQSPPGLVDSALNLPVDAVSDLADRVSNVADFHAWLGAPAPLSASWPDTWSVFGVGQPTEVRIGFVNGTANPFVTTDGDGTVPHLSAQALSVPTNHSVELSGLIHATACLDQRVLDLLGQILA